MCLTASVGEGGRNAFTDVKVVQTLLNLNRHRYGERRPALLKPDGMFGAKTLRAIQDFETKILRQEESDGLVTPNDPTLAGLADGLPEGFSKDKLVAIVPYALAEKIDLFAGLLARAMPQHGISSDLRVAHFLAQVAHESGSFRYTEEIASGDAYEGRADLGNVRPGDGRRFKGRGLIQLTGRANYQAYSDDSGVDYVSNPSAVARDPAVCVDVACWFWRKRGLNGLADTDDVRAVTKRINGGFNGLDDRIAFLQRARFFI